MLISCNKNGPDSDKLVGSWLGNGELELNNGHTGINTETVMNLQKPGNGNIIYKVKNETMGKIVYSYSIKYNVSWLTRVNSTEEFLIIRFKDGQILNNSSINKQDIEKQIDKRIRENDTTFFSIQPGPSILCHRPHYGTKFIMNKLN